MMKYGTALRVPYYFWRFTLWLVLLCPVICTMAKALWKR